MLLAISEWVWVNKSVSVLPCVVIECATRLGLTLILLNTNSDTLRRVVQADLDLQPRSSACWTAQLLSAFQGLRGCELYVRAVQTGHAITLVIATVYCRFEA